MAMNSPAGKNLSPNTKSPWKKGTHSPRNKRHGGFANSVQQHQDILKIKVIGLGDE